MKKKILSFLTAFAVAAFCLIAPVKSGIGFNVDVDASDIEGLSAEALGTANIKALEEGDQFKLIVTVPSTAKKLDTIELNILFNSDVFDVIKWCDNDEAPTLVTGSVAESAGIKTADTAGYSYLSYTAVGVKAGDEHSLDLSAGLTLEAILEVKNVEDDRGTKEFELITTADLFQCGYMRGTSWVPVWEPSAEDAKTTVKISNTITGLLTGVDLTGLAVGESAWVVVYDGSTVVGCGEVDVISATKAFFEIISGPEDDKKSYDLKLRVGADEDHLSPLWGVFTDYKAPTGMDKPVTFVEPKFTNNKLTDKTGTAQIKGSKEKRNIGTLTFRLFGDTDKDGSVGAGDATHILRYIVGNASAIDDTDPALLTINEGIANVLDTDAIINAKDATQILRKIIGFSSVFDGRG